MIEMSTVSRGDGAEDSNRRDRLKELIERAVVSPQHTTSGGSLCSSIANGQGSRFRTFRG